jgi:hypothetical protein
MLARIAALALALAGLAAVPAAAQSPDQLIYGADLRAPVAGTVACDACLVWNAAAPPVPWAGVVTQAQVLVTGPGSVLLVPFDGASPSGTGPVMGADVAPGTQRVSLTATQPVPVLPGQSLALLQVYSNQAPSGGSAHVAYTATPGATTAQALVRGTYSVVHPPTTAAADAAPLFQATLQRVPVAQAITPHRGSFRGGTTVTLTGYNFDLATGVTFDGVPATSWRAAPPAMAALQSTITAVTPPGVGGQPDIRVLGPAGAPSVMFKGAFTFTGCVPPDLRGWAWDANSRRLIRWASCQVGSVRWRGRHARKARVVSVRPRAGRTYPVGTRVNVVLRAKR